MRWVDLNQAKKKKRYLNQYLELLEELEREREHMLFWYEKARAIKIQDLTQIRESSSKFSPSDKYLDLENDIKNRIEMSERKRLEIQDAIACLKDPVCRRVLLHRYIDGMAFSQIAKQMNYSEQHIYRLHQRALKKFIIPK